MATALRASIRCSTPPGIQTALGRNNVRRRPRGNRHDPTAGIHQLRASMSVKRECFSFCEFPSIGHYRLGEGLEVTQVLVDRDNDLARSRHFVSACDE